MKLLTTKEVATAIGFDEGVQTQIIDTAIAAASSELAGILRTRFDRVAVVDTFYVLPTGSIPLGSTYRTRLALSRGFVAGAATITFGDLLGDLDGRPESVSNSIASVDAEKGGVVITGPDLRNRYVRVSYSAGFDTDDNGMIVDMPPWLKEAAIQSTIKTLDITAPTMRHDEKSSVDTKSQMMALMAMLEGKIRLFPSATHPIA